MAAASQPTVGILPEEADLHTAEARVNKHKADWRGWKFMWPFTVVFVFVFIIPIVYAVYISFFKKQMIGGTRFVGVENYARLLQDGQFWSSVGRVALFTCVQVPIMLFLSAAMALALDSMKLHGAKFFRISTFLPYAVPAVVSTLVWGFVYGAKYGLVGSFNDFFGTNVDVLQPSVLLASIGNISTWEFTGSLITIIPLVIAFLCLQKYWQSGLAAGAVKEQLLLPLTLLREGSWRNGVLTSLSEESCRTQ
ncbi:Permease protein of ABC transporter system for sugars, galactan metabolism [Bifidobacterium breve JCM 7019]|nr:Permease protein of ABC transporter system for sugars, galactan metabolism [Bifidobacterium breve JCM 7019]